MRVHSHVRTIFLFRPLLRPQACISSGFTRATIRMSIVERFACSMFLGRTSATSGAFSHLQACKDAACRLWKQLRSVNHKTRGSSPAGQVTQPALATCCARFQTLWNIFWQLDNGGRGGGDGGGADLFTNLPKSQYLQVHVAMVIGLWLTSLFTQ